MTEFGGAAIEGLLIVLAWPNIIYPIAGTLLAMVVAFLPGINAAALMALAVPLTLTWEPVPVLLLFGALVGGATFMGSITAILFNIPGAAPAAATMLDGYPMAQRGEARTAIACAASASALGSTVGVVVLIALLPVTRAVLTEFGPAEHLAMGLWGLAMVAAVSRGSMLKGLALAGIGLLLAFIGRDPRTSELRFTLGLDYLADGLPPALVLLGLFAVPEIVDLATTRGLSLSGHGRATDLVGSTRAGLLAPFRHPALFWRSSVIGTLIGLLPGVGGTVAGFVAYAAAVQTARDRERFGKGDTRGVIATEAAIDAKDGGSLLPVFAFGLPGSEGTVFLITALLIHGVVPDKEMLEQHLTLVFVVIWALFVSNWLTSIIGLGVAGWCAKLTVVPTRTLFPFLAVLIVIGALAQRGETADLVTTLLFGAAGWCLKRQGWPRAPLAIAFVLGGMVERQFQLTWQLFRHGRIAVLERPLLLVLVLMLSLTLVLPLIGRRRSLLPDRAG